MPGHKRRTLFYIAEHRAEYTESTAPEKEHALSWYITWSWRLGNHLSLPATPVSNGQQQQQQCVYITPGTVFYLSVCLPIYYIKRKLVCFSYFQTCFYLLQLLLCRWVYYIFCYIFHFGLLSTTAVLCPCSISANFHVCLSASQSVSNRPRVTLCPCLFFFFENKKGFASFRTKKIFSNLSRALGIDFQYYDSTHLHHHPRKKKENIPGYRRFFFKWTKIERRILFSSSFLFFSDLFRPSGNSAGQPVAFFFFFFVAPHRDILHSPSSLPRQPQCRFSFAKALSAPPPHWFPTVFPLLFF